LQIFLNFFSDVLTAADDGVSGTIFERKGFKEMIAEIEAGNVGAVIVKEAEVKHGINKYNHFFNLPRGSFR